MAMFELQGQDGKSYEVEAPSAEEAVNAFKQFSAPQTPKNPDPGFLASMASGLRQGTSFGFSDEIDGALMAGLHKLAGSKQSLSDLYKIGRDTSRFVNNAAAENRPVTYYGSQFAGGVAPGVATGGAGLTARAAGAGLLARSGAAAAEGGAMGALHGAGSADGDLSDRAVGAAKSGAAGLAIGGLMPGAVDVVSATARGVAAPFRGVFAPEKFGRQKLAEAVLRDRNPQDVGGRGVNRVVDDLALRRATSGKDLMMMDMGGENTRNLMRAAGNMSSTGAQRLNRALDNRQAGQWRRIERDMSAALGNPDDYATTVGDLISSRAAAARTNYDAALAVETPMTPRLRAVLGRPVFSGRRDGQNTGDGGLLRLAHDALQNEGAQVGLQTRTQALHYVKMQIDKQIGAARRAQQMGNSPPSGWDVRTLTIAKRDLLNAIENDAYKAANRQFAGDIALQNAAEDGFENALRMHTEEIAPLLRGMTDGERHMWRLGAARAIAGKIRAGNVTRDRTESLFSSPDMRMRMQAFFPDNRSLREFQRNLVLEARMADTRKAVQGETTTAKQLAQGQEAGQPVAAVNAAANAAAGRFGPLLDYMGRQANRFSGLTPRTANAVIDAGMTRSGSRMPEALTSALRAAERAPEHRAAVAGGANASANALIDVLKEVGRPNRRR